MRKRSRSKDYKTMCERLQKRWQKLKKYINLQNEYALSQYKLKVNENHNNYFRGRLDILISIINQAELLESGKRTAKLVSSD